MIQQRVRSNPCVESLIEDRGQTTCFVDLVGVNANASKCMWKKKSIRLMDDHNELMTHI